MKKVQVLMSTYNGEKYIAEQIESILAQKNVKLYLRIRDDGSTDATYRILSSYAAENVYVYTGPNIGVQKSYFELLTSADSQMDYYAFSDQDDVWHPDKLQKAVKALDSQTDQIPLLYAGRVIYASQDLQSKKRFSNTLPKRPSFGNALAENICMGCTEVFNHRLWELVCSHPPNCGILHDWWMYLTAAYFGEVIFDEHAYLLYRQHGNNQIGMQSAWGKRWMHRVLHIRKLHGRLSCQADDFLHVYHKLLKETSEQQQKVALLLTAGYRQSRKKKIRIVMSNIVYRQNQADHAVYKLLFCLGYL